MLGNNGALYLLFLVPVVLIPAYVWCFYRKAIALRALASVQMLRQINVNVSLKKQLFKASLLLVGFVTIVVALTEPKWNPKPVQIKRQGRDVCIVLDVSHSMLAEDVRPSRLEQAKLAVSDLMETLAGDRIAIVTFAGKAVVKCPLTQDYAFVRMVLSQIDTESTGRGGTNVGDAIRTACNDVFDNQSREFKDIILITDGEEHEGEDSFPVTAAENAGEEGIRIIAIGLGDENEGARIPITGPDGNVTFLQHEGREVWTKLDADMLRKIAIATDGGKYITVGPGETLDLGSIYETLIQSAAKRELESASMTRYDEKFQIFLTLAIILLVCEALISERRKA
jgi:Ca-activated chloride channel family protein